MSLMVRRSAWSLLNVPGTAVSPCSTARRVICPLIGALIVVFARSDFEFLSAASAWSIECFAASNSAWFTSTVVLSCSSCSAEMRAVFVCEISSLRWSELFDWSRFALARA